MTKISPQRRDARRRIASGLIGLLAASSGACGRDPSSPTPPAQGAQPTAQLTVTIDSVGSSVAIPAVSRVRFDGTGSTASDAPVQYLVDYGDGTSGSERVSEHVYTAPGTYTASITLVDGRGRRATASHVVTVRIVQGAWFHAGFNPVTKRVEIRRLRAHSQDGPSVRAELVDQNQTITPITATLQGERTLRFSVAGAEIEGNIPSDVFGEGAVMALRGFPRTEGELPFVSIIGEPFGPPPVAQLDIQIDSHRSPAAILGLSPVRFSATGSSGDGAQYVIEFGDGEFTTESTGIHRCTVAGEVESYVTVIDRFGRANSRSRRFWCIDLYSRGSWIYTSRLPEAHEQRSLSFFKHSDQYVQGVYRHPDGNLSPFTGTLTGERSVRFVLDGGGIEFTGDIIIGDLTWMRHMDLRLRGGSADGRTLRFLFYEPY